MVKAEAGDLEVMAIDKVTILSAQKVLLCGNIENPFSVISTGTLVLRDFTFRTAAVDGVSVKTGVLRLEEQGLFVIQIHMPYLESSNFVAYTLLNIFRYGRESALGAT